ncbi:MAG: hypothetical protein RMY34_14480 [Aulosira sp. DedQUE10]|nr:hypothetical protein [Aulosira sp. DedQUE10]
MLVKHYTLFTFPVLFKSRYQYFREGTCNLFVFYAPHYGWRHVEVTSSRTQKDFAHQMKDLVDVHFPRGENIRVVLDQYGSVKAMQCLE